MRAIFQSFWVRKLIGKLGVPYNRRLQVRGSPHPIDYDAGLSFPAAESNAFRAHSLCVRPDAAMALTPHPGPLLPAGRDEERENYFVGRFPRVVAPLQPWAIIFHPILPPLQGFGLASRLCAFALKNFAWFAVTPSVSLARAALA